MQGCFPMEINSQFPLRLSVVGWFNDGIPPNNCRVSPSRSRPYSADCRLRKQERKAADFPDVRRALLQNAWRKDDRCAECPGTASAMLVVSTKYWTRAEGDSTVWLTLHQRHILPLVFREQFLDLYQREASWLIPDPTMASVQSAQGSNMG